MLRVLLLAGLIIIALIVTGCSEGQQGPAAQAARQSKTMAKRPPSFFYRMKADFILKETGERVSFDYVAACGGVVFSNPHTTQTAFLDHHPTIMFRQIDNGHALGLVTIDMCESWKWDDYRYGAPRAPEGLRPLAIWFEDINDLSLGWGYKTDDAYDSPLAKIEFVQASVEKTDETAWKAWRNKAEADYEQVGALPGPWGYNYSHEAGESQRETFVRGKGYGIANAICPASFRVKVNKDYLDAIFAKAPDGVGRYWLLVDAKKYAPEEVLALLRDRSAFGEGEPIGNYRNYDNYFLGTISSEEPKHVLPKTWSEANKDGYAYREVFPFLKRSSAMPDVDEPQSSYLQKIDLSEERKGFGACASGGRPLDMLVLFSSPQLREQWGFKAFDPEGLTKQHTLYIGNTIVAGEPWRTLILNQNPPAVIDREGYFFGLDR